MDNTINTTLSCKRVGPYVIRLYFLDDGSLIIDKYTSIKLIPSDLFEIIRTTGSPYLSQLSGKEVYDFFVGSHRSLDKNDLSSGTECKE